MRRTFATAAAVTFGGLCLLAALIVGCGEPTAGYEPELRYPLRTDVLVVRPPLPPAVRHPSGKLDEFLAGHPDRGGLVLDPAALDDGSRTKLTAALNELFGTPAAPVVRHELAASLGLTDAELARGSVLYKDKCVQCHGFAGDGRGPTSLFTHPVARDFRRGQYKFVSAAGGVPSRADLEWVIRHGLTGNAMPPFELLPPADVAALAAYTTHLSLRGQVEYAALAATLGEDGLDGDVSAFARGELAKAIAAWAAADAKAVRPAETPAVEPRDAGDPAHDGRVRRGFTLFRTSGGCVQCHKDYGREPNPLYDVWGTMVQPADLTVGDLKGGKSPLAVYRRIACGIQPSGMPAATLGEPQTWDVVAFVLSLPTPRHLPADVRREVYPGAK